jgi:hypothetical protein
MNSVMLSTVTSLLFRTTTPSRVPPATIVRCFPAPRSVMLSLP